MTENGDIVGSVLDGDINTAAVLPADAQEPELLEVPDDAGTSVAVGANDDGMTSGYYLDADNVGVPVVWDEDGFFTELELPGDLDADTYIRMNAVSGDFAVGHVAETPGVYGSIVWNLTEGGEGTLVSENQLYGDINPDGATVGHADGAPALQIDGEQAELPGDAGAANGISDDAGVLVGEVDSDEDSKEAVIWTATE